MVVVVVVAARMSSGWGSAHRECSDRRTLATLKRGCTDTTWRGGGRRSVASGAAFDALLDAARRLLFFPTAADMSLYPALIGGSHVGMMKAPCTMLLILSAATHGASLTLPCGTAVRTEDGKSLAKNPHIPFLAMFYLHHVRRWASAEPFIVADGLLTLAGLVLSTNLYLRSQACDCLTQLSSTTDFDWYHHRVITITRSTLDWLRFTYVSESRSAELCDGAGMPRAQRGTPPTPRCAGWPRPRGRASSARWRCTCRRRSSRAAPSTGSSAPPLAQRLSQVSQVAVSERSWPFLNVRGHQRVGWAHGPAQVSGVLAVVAAAALHGGQQALSLRGAAATAPGVGPADGPAHGCVHLCSVPLAAVRSSLSVLRGRGGGAGREWRRRRAGAGTAAARRLQPPAPVHGRSPRRGASVHANRGAACLHWAPVAGLTVALRQCGLVEPRSFTEPWSSSEAKPLACDGGACTRSWELCASSSARSDLALTSPG
jgi:hypothetical protein